MNTCALGLGANAVSISDYFKFPEQMSQLVDEPLRAEVPLWVAADFFGNNVSG